MFPSLRATDQEEDCESAPSPAARSQRPNKSIRGSLNVDKLQSDHGVKEYNAELRKAGLQPASGLNVGKMLADEQESGNSSKDGKRRRSEGSGPSRKKTKVLQVPDVEELTYHLIENKYKKALANLDPASEEYASKINNIYLYAQTEKAKAESHNELRTKQAEYEDKNNKFLELQHDTAASVQYDINQLQEKIKHMQAEIKTLEEKKAKMQPDKVQALKATIAKKAADSAESDVEAIKKEIKGFDDDLTNIDALIQGK